MLTYAMSLQEGSVLDQDEVGKEQEGGVTGEGVGRLGGGAVATWTTLLSCTYIIPHTVCTHIVLKICTVRRYLSHLSIPRQLL